MSTFRQYQIESIERIGLKSEGLKLLADRFGQMLVRSVATGGSPERHAILSELAMETQCDARDMRATMSDVREDTYPRIRREGTKPVRV